MSYEDFSEVIYLPSVVKGGQGSIQKVKTTPKSDVGLFAAPLGYYSDTTAASGDQLPWGVASVWANGESNADGVPVDWTGVADAKIVGNFSYFEEEGDSLITDSSYDVGAGVSKILLEDPTDLSSAVNKFAIVIDSGVAKLDDFNIGTISESLSMSFVDSNYNSILSDETFSLNGVQTNTAFEDTVGHGTHVAGTIAAKADGKGVVGVAPGAEVISLKVFGNTGSTTFEIIYDAVSAAIDYVLEDTTDLYTSTGEIKYLGIAEKDTSALNVDNTVINLSLGGGLNAQSQPIVDLIESAAAQGVKFSIAGGNSNADVDYTSPAAAGAVENVYTVSAVDKKYVMASFTNYDDDDDGGVNDDVDVAGPGVDVLSYTGQSGSIQAWSGTSMAAPAIAGLLLMTPQDGEGPTKENGDGDQVSDTGDGLQDGEDVFPNYTTFTDPYAVSTLYGGIEPYQDGFNDDDQPDDAPDGDDDWQEGDDTDENDYNNESPWNGYNPDNYYFETVGNIKGQLGTYSMSTGPSSVQQVTLEEDLGIISGDLDKSMKSYVESESSSFFTGYTNANSSTKNSINATEGSGIKFTGYAKAGDTLVFDYLIASNDYIPYNDFAFVQLKTGDALGNWDGQTELQSLGSIGLDVDNFGTKKGSFSYTLTAADFNDSNYSTTTAPADADGDGDVDADDLVYDTNGDGLYDISDKLLNINGLGNITQDDYILDSNNDGVISSSDLDEDGNLTFGGVVFAENIAISEGSASEQFVLDYLAITDPGTTPTYSYATADADFLTYTGFAAEDFSVAFEGVEEFGDYVLDINDDGVISELDKVYDFNNDLKITASDLAIDASDADTLITEADLDLNLNPELGVSTTYGTESFFMLEADATTAGLTGNSYYVYKSETLDVVETGFDGTAMAALATEGVDPIYQGFFDLSAGVTDAIDGWVDTTLMVKGMGLIPEGEEGSLIDETDEANYVEGSLAWSEDNKLGNGTVSNNIANMSTGSGSVGQSVLEAIIGLEDGVLDTDLNDTKYAIDATSGSGAYATTYAQIGDVISFDYSFDTNDYSPYKDFSWFSVNDTVEKIVALGEDVENFGKAKGTITYTLTEEDFDGNYTAPFTDENGDANDGGGKLTVGFGVMDALDTCVDSYLSISNVYVYNPDNSDEIPDEIEEATTDEIINDFSQFETNFYGNVTPTFTAVDSSFLDLNADDVIDWEDAVWDFDGNGSITDDDLITDLNEDGFIDINDVVVDIAGATDAAGAVIGDGLIDASDVDTDGNYTFFVDNLDTEAAIGFVASADQATGLLYKETYGDEEINEILGEFMQVDAGSDVVGNTPYADVVAVDVAYDELDQVVLSTQFNYDGTAYTGDPEADIATANTLESDDIEWYTGLESGILSTSLNGSKNSIDATTGSAISLSGVGAVGDTFSFDFAFASTDYNPFEDFAYVSVNEEAYVLQNVDSASETYGQTAVVTNLFNAIGDSDFSGYFEYTLSKSDLGGENFGEFIISAGVMNALDNGVETTLTLSNFDYSPGELLQTDADGTLVGDLEDSYEDDFSAYFETIGDVYVESDAYGGFSLSTAGNVVTANAKDSDNSLENFAQLANKTLDKVMLINDGWTNSSFSGKSTKDKINATEGSAVQFGAQAEVGDTAYFYYYFETNDYTPYADFSWYSVGDKAYMIAGVGTNVDNWGAKEGFIEYTVTENDINADGDFVLTVGIVDAKDGAVESNIDIWGFGITGDGETTPDYEAPEGIQNEDYVNEFDDEYFDGNDEFILEAGSYFDLDGDGFLTDADLILDYNNDGVINYMDMLKQVDNSSDEGDAGDDEAAVVVSDWKEGLDNIYSALGPADNDAGYPGGTPIEENLIDTYYLDTFGNINSGLWDQILASGPAVTAEEVTVDANNPFQSGDVVVAADTQIPGFTGGEANVTAYKELLIELYGGEVKTVSEVFASEGGMGGGENIYYSEDDFAYGYFYTDLAALDLPAFGPGFPGTQNQADIVLNGTPYNQTTLATPLETGVTVNGAFNNGSTFLWVKSDPTGDEDYIPFVNILTPDTTSGLGWGYGLVPANGAEITGWDDMEAILFENPSWQNLGANDAESTWSDVVNEFGKFIPYDIDAVQNGDYVLEYLTGMKDEDFFEVTIDPDDVTSSVLGLSPVFFGLDDGSVPTVEWTDGNTYLDIDGNGSLDYADMIIAFNDFGDGPGEGYIDQSAEKQMLLLDYSEAGAGYDITFDYLLNSDDYITPESGPVSNIDGVLDAEDLVQGDGGVDTVKFSSVAQNDKSYNFEGIETTDAYKGFFVSLDSSDLYDVMTASDYVDEDFDYAGDYAYFDFLSEENAAYVFGTTASAEIPEGSGYSFISLEDEDFYEDTDGDGYEDGYWDDYDPDQDSNYADEKPDDSEEVYEEIDIEMLGNTFQAGDSVVMSTGGGAIDQYDIENALGLKDGALDEAFATYDLNGNVVEVTKEAIDATQGSAAYDTVEVKVGDVINFGFTFGTDDYIPYQDFAFFALNGQAHSLATVGVEVDSYGEFSDVYNYVISADDLGGDNSGVVTIGVGIMDAIDYCVDSYVEVYDFQISGDEKYDDSTNDGIVDGESAYSINTAVGVSSFNVATSNTVKLSFKGKSLSAETSNVYDVVASAASTVINGGYQVLLEGTGKKDGKWFVHQTDAYGAIKAGKKSGWKTENKAVDLGWEQIFNFDINGDSILEGTADTDALKLYSAQTGGITISNFETTLVGQTDANGEAVTDDNGDQIFDAVTETSIVNQGEIDILAATPSKADFTTFSTPGETLQMLVAGTGENVGKFQVWTTLEDGTVIDKSGYTDWSKDVGSGEWTKTENDWYTSAQAIAVGLEDDFSYDIDSNGVLSGGSSYKILGPNGGLVIKNAKGIALDQVTAPYYSPLAAVKTKKGYDLALEGAAGSNYEGLYSIWKTNEYGKVLTEAEWITEAQFVAGKYEEFFNVDVNSDGLVGVSDLIDSSDNSDTKLAVGAKNSTSVQTTDNEGVILSTVLTNQKGKNLKLKVGSFTMLDAETVAGEDADGNAVDLNQVVFKAKNNKTIQIYNYSDDWSTYESKTKIKAKTSDFYQAEIDFNQDLNNDGIIATTDGVDANGDNVYVAKALVVSEEGLTDMYKNDANQVLFTYGQTNANGDAVTDVNGNQIFDEFTLENNAGKAIKAKQGKFEVADVMSTDDLELKIAFNSGKALKIYTLADPDATEDSPVVPEAIKISGIQTISSKKAGFFEQEIAFGTDFNEDGIIGNISKADASAAVGDYTAQYDYQNKAFYKTDVEGVDTSFELQNKKGKQLGATFGKFELSGVGEIGTDGIFTAVYKNSKTDMLSIYEMTDVLDTNQVATGDKKQVGKTKKVNSKSLTKYLQYETDFGIDFNGDGFVGKDIAGAVDADGNVIGDGTFDDTDLITGETKGQVEQYTDLAGNIYALTLATDTTATALTVNDEAFVDGAYKKLKGWSVLGLDTTFTEDGSVNNVGIFGKGKKFKMISFGSDWNFDSSKDSSDAITTYNTKKLLNNNIEDLFVQDLNNDSFI